MSPSGAVEKGGAAAASTADGWLTLADGRRVWGRFGAAGLLLRRQTGEVLLQHRVAWSHFGGTWGLPGGARLAGESALAAALREAAEEASVPAAAVRPLFCSVTDFGGWTYSTVAAAEVGTVHPVIADRESQELAWVPTDRVDAMALHPGFAAAWPRLRAELNRPRTLLIDAANVVGSRPDGWWRDRAGATERFATELTALARAGMPGDSLDTELDRVWPEIILVLEGEARAARLDLSVGAQVILAPADGDSELLREVTRQRHRNGAADIVAVTADRALRAQLERAGARTRSPGWLRGLLYPAVAINRS